MFGRQKLTAMSSITVRWWYGDCDMSDSSVEAVAVYENESLRFEGRSVAESARTSNSLESVHQRRPRAAKPQFRIKDALSLVRASESQSGRRAPGKRWRIKSLNRMSGVGIW